jgi:hypothetical protein
VVAGQGWHKTTILFKKATRKCRLFCLHYIKTCKKYKLVPKYAVCKITREKEMPFRRILLETVFT